MKEREFTAYLMGFGFGTLCISTGVLVGSKSAGDIEYGMVGAALFGLVTLAIGWRGNWKLRKIDQEERGDE